MLFDSPDGVAQYGPDRPTADAEPFSDRGGADRCRLRQYPFRDLPLPVA